MFWKNFKEICEEHNKKPTQVVVDLGLSRSLVTSWKNGGYPSAKTVKRIAEYFDVPVLRFWASDAEEEEKHDLLIKEQVTKTIDNILKDTHQKESMAFLVPYLSDVCDALNQVAYALFKLKFDAHTCRQNGIPVKIDKKFLFDSEEFQKNILEPARKACEHEKNEERQMLVDGFLINLEERQNDLIVKVLLVQKKIEKMAQQYAVKALKESEDGIDIISEIPQAEIVEFLKTEKAKKNER